MTGWLQRLLWVWERLQVELNGQYSRKRLQAFQNFRQRVSLVQAVTVVLVTPLPCLLIVVAADAIPLQPVERGLAHSGAFWMRSLFTVGVFTIALLVQCETYIPRLSLSLWERMTIVLAVSSLAVASCYPLICLIGFPVPFSISLLSVPWLSLFVMSLWLARGRLIRTDKATRAGLQEFAYIGLTQTVTTVVYQAFYAAFSQMSPSAQTKFVLLLPVLKLVQKNATTHLMHDKDDSKPEVVTFNVELFHSMFVSCCMQRSTSKITSFVLMSVDFTQVCISLYDLNRMLSAIEALAIENRLRKEDFVAVALLIASLEPVAIARDQRSTVVTPTTPFQAAPGKTRGRIGGVQVNNFHAKKKLSPPQSMVRTAWIHPMNRVAARGATTRTVTDALSGQHKTIFVQNLLRAMFLIEFLLLIEFVEVMIPATYCEFFFANLLSTRPLNHWDLQYSH